MNSRAFTLSLIIAALAMFMVYSYIEGREAEYTKKFGQQKTVVVATQDIGELDILDDSKVNEITVPASFVSPGAISSRKEIANTIATVPILKGEQITRPRLTYPGARTGLSRQVSLGKRAVSFPVSEEQSVGKLIRPGDRVDIISTVDFAGGRKDLSRVSTVFQDVLILSTGLSVTNAVPIVNVNSVTGTQKLNLNTYTTYNSITVELDPFQAQKLIFLLTVNGARPYLVLRNNDDKSILKIRPTNFFELLQEDAQEAKDFFQSQNRR